MQKLLAWQKARLKTMGINPEAVQGVLDSDPPGEPPKWGEPARAKCSAPGRMLGEVHGRRLVLYVSAMDNSLNIDDWDPDGMPAGVDLPLPSREALAAASAALSYANLRGWKP